MNKSQYNWKCGKVVNWDIDDLDLNKSLGSQVELLKEDLAQVHFGENIVLNLGWYPEFNLQGQFGLVVVKLKNQNDPGHDWANPILELRFSELLNFDHKLNQAIEFAEQASRKKD
jgi:hypothetical protein